MWPSLIAQAKRGGVHVIQTYVFWNLHEPQQGQFDFIGRRNLLRFIKEIQAQGLYATLRIGPFIEAEWSQSAKGVYRFGCVFRSDNEPFKIQMENFKTKIVNMMKEENLYASQGGPIILSRIENEYTLVEPAFHEKGPPYVRWAANMSVSLQTGFPWVMCRQDDAPDPMIGGPGPMIVKARLVFVYSLGRISSCGRLQNNKLSPALVLNPNIAASLTSPLKFVGFKCCSLNLTGAPPLLLPSSAIMFPPPT